MAAFPRWCAYLNVWCGALLFPAILALLLKDGLFAYSGGAALWIPLVAFFIRMVALTVVMHRDAPAELRASMK